MISAAPPIITALSARIAAYGGAALIIDYGCWGSRGDTFQALYAHAFADPFAAPGTADLTAHVDFAALAAAATTPYAFATQGDFLDRLGIVQRSARLAAKLRGTALDSHLAATRRLTDAAEMGTLFKTLSLHPAGSSPSPGMN